MPTKYTTATEPVTPEERERIQRGRNDWHPQRALNHAWARVDPVHGRGGSHHGGRPSRPGDPGYGEGWTRAGFWGALQNDREEIEDVIATYPEQAPRLRQWLEAMEALGRRRDRDTRPRARVGSYYEALQALGYTYTSFPENDDDF